MQVKYFPVKLPYSIHMNPVTPTPLQTRLRYILFQSLGKWTLKIWMCVYVSVSACACACACAYAYVCACNLMCNVCCCQSHVQDLFIIPKSAVCSTLGHCTRTFTCDRNPMGAFGRHLTFKEVATKSYMNHAYSCIYDAFFFFLQKTSFVFDKILFDLTFCLTAINIWVILLSWWFY